MNGTHATITALCLAVTMAAAQSTGTDLIISNDGTVRFSPRSMSFSGLGKTEFSHECFTLSVRGQFRMQASARVTRSPRYGKGKFSAQPAWTSLVALGEVILELPGTEPKRFHAGKAVYRFDQDRWLLDGREITPDG